MRVLEQAGLSVGNQRRWLQGNQRNSYAASGGRAWRQCQSAQKARGFGSVALLCRAAQWRRLDSCVAHAERVENAVEEHMACRVTQGQASVKSDFSHAWLLYG